MCAEFAGHCDGQAAAHVVCQTRFHHFDDGIPGGALWITDAIMIAFTNCSVRVWIQIFLVIHVPLVQLG
jgi:hypothetical protein